MTITHQQINLTPIGVVHSPYKEKFAIPRQPGLVSAANGSIVLSGLANNRDLVRDLEQFSHLWLIFIFHGTQDKGWQPLVRPPRLGGNKKTGVFATRSTFRPNPIGMSVVKLENIEQNNNEVILHISGLDLLDQTPVIDIKPYIPYSDSILDATAGFAQHPPKNMLTISFSKNADISINNLKKQYPDLKVFIEQVLAQDPRPAYKQGKIDDKIYGMNLYNLNIQWQMTALNSSEVIAINDTNNKTVTK